MQISTDLASEPLPDATNGFPDALAAAGVGLWRWHPATGAVTLSPQAAALLGCPPHATLPHATLDYAGFLALLHQDDNADADRTLRDSLAATAAFDFIVRPASGQHRLRLRGQPLAGTAPEVTGIVITSLRHTAAEAMASRLAAIVKSSDAAIIGKTLDGIVTDWNSGAEAIFGYAAADIIGQPLAVLLPLGQPDDMADILARIKAGERVEHYETHRRRKDGTIIDVSLTLSPVYDSNGRLVGASKIARDITEAKRAQAQLLDREAHFRAVLDTIPDAMIVIDANAIIRWFSTTAERLFGYAAAEAVGRNVNLLMPAPYREQHDSYLAHYFATGEKRVIGQGRVVVGRRKDGTTFPMELSVGEINVAGRRSFTGFVRDLTERQETQRRLQELQAELIHMSRFTAMGEMASTLAHELNQPLTAVASYLNGCRRLLGGDESLNSLMLRDAIDRAADQALRAGQIIRRLRQFVARGETERQAENLVKLIEEASALALVGVKEAGVRVNFALDRGVRFVLADKIQIQQVILNLIRNAIEAMQETTVRDLTIATVEQPDEMVEISIADTGPGIAPDIAAQLFQPFVTSKPQGMGVGLSISRTIVEAHGGRLWAEPNPEGGTIFRLTLKALNTEELHDGV
jgi:two-component system sensor kinase FixL